MSRFNDRYFPSKNYTRTKVISKPMPSNGIGVVWITCPGCDSNVKYLEEEGVCIRCANMSTYEAVWKTEAPGVPEDWSTGYNEPEVPTYKYKP